MFTSNEPKQIIGRWKVEKIYFDSDLYFEDILNGIRYATRSVDLETYIFDPGILADRVVDALIAAAQRGVKVRVLVDGIGSPDFYSRYYKRLHSVGIKVRIFRTHPWVLKRLPGDPEHIWRRILVRFANVNSGDHRKLCLVDEERLWAGSQNISDVHLREVHGNRAWRDIGMYVEGPDVFAVERAFSRAFRRLIKPKALHTKSSLVLLNDGFASRKRAAQVQLGALKNAQKRVWIQTPYFVPIPSLYRQLVRCAETGIDVRIMIPKLTDVEMVRSLSFAFFDKMLRAGVKIFEYSPRFAHQKLFIVDDWITVGSSNLNHRSFLHDLELDLVVTDPDNKRLLENAFLSDQEESDALLPNYWSTLPIWKRLYSNILLWFRYWA